MNEPTYTIMIMSNNNHNMLAECLRRVKLYTPIPHEVVVVDDASEPAYQIEGATVVRMPKRSNCCNLRNVGMEMSKTDYVFWLDNDCFVGPGWYQPLVDVVESDPMVGLTGQPKDSRLIRNPFFPINQADCMIEYQFAYDYDHNTSLCDFITSYCILVKKEAWRPTYCYGMPTPVLDPDLGANIKVNGYKVKVASTNLPVEHMGTGTPRPEGYGYHYHLAENFARWFRFWKPHAPKVFELYSGREIAYSHDANESGRAGSKGHHGDKDLGPDINE